MGILTTYAIYRYGKKKAEKARAQEEADALEICTNCGWEKYRHSPSGDCPAY